MFFHCVRGFARGGGGGISEIRGWGGGGIQGSPPSVSNTVMSVSHKKHKNPTINECL